MEKQLYQSENGKIIRQHIVEVVNELDSVMDIKGDDPLSVAVQTQARKLAITTLNKLLQLTDYEETNKKEINKERFGL
jgi:LDH2 family malate/lactate/ureidoglycolate dehydrogenase